MGDDERADRIIASAPPGIADNVGIAFLQTGEFGRIEPGIHARQNRKAAAGRQRKGAFVAKRCHIGFIRRDDFVENLAHRAPPEAGKISIVSKRRRSTEPNLI
jgi:hypothetical protein